MARLTPSNYKPILQYHFIVEFDNYDMELQQNSQNYAKGADLPAADNNPISIEYGNTYMWVKGKTRWNSITMQFYSLSSPNTNGKLWQYINAHQKVESGTDDFKENYMGDVTIKLLNPDETEVGKWRLINAFISAINWGSVDWGAEDVIQPEITFVYDYAIWS
tara:strand:- start:1482 stop:1970 length:489 start_codon:yes stop_codon:yes gene_type:complete